MKPFVLITGNQHKADYLAKWLDMPIDHQKVNLDELQSLDPREIIEHKVRAAYDIVSRPVLVEDVSLTFTAMGRLPGPFVKWFLQEMGVEGLIKIAATLAHRQAIASILYAYYDGTAVRIFEGSKQGTVAEQPRGLSSFGALSWNSLFIPEGSNKTYAEMDDEELKPFSHRWQAIEKLKIFLDEE